ncbi:MAG: hypothetical protein IJX02_01205 [Clostridia bacterium]|nr:hypothetical protein [Clostridia bacterium]
MKKYIEPAYIVEGVETKDVILSSSIKDAGEATVGTVTGDKGIFETLFGEIL